MVTPYLRTALRTCRELPVMVEQTTHDSLSFGEQNLAGSTPPRCALSGAGYDRVVGARVPVPAGWSSQGHGSTMRLGHPSSGHLLAVAALRHLTVAVILVIQVLRRH
jgi:hypothetical protein